MLIETPYKTGDTVSLKLTSGEEVVARLDKETEKGYELHKPLMLTATQQGVGLAPFMFTVGADSKFIINTQSVVCIAKTEKEAASQYVQTTTGLTV